MKSHYCGESPETVDEYILARDADIREQLQRVREVIRDELPLPIISEIAAWCRDTGNHA